MRRFGVSGGKVERLRGVKRGRHKVKEREREELSARGVKIVEPK